jgi:hypothetical protein
VTLAVAALPFGRGLVFGIGSGAGLDQAKGAGAIERVGEGGQVL